APLVVDAVGAAVSGVDVLGLLIRPECPRPEAQDPAAAVGQREGDAAAEAVVDPLRIVAVVLDDPGGGHLLRGVAGVPGAHQDPIPGAGRVADPELLQDLRIQPAALQLLARGPSLVGLPQLPLVE